RAQRPAPRFEAWSWSWLISLAGSAGGSGNASLDQHFEEARIIAGAARLLANVEHFACACIDNAIRWQDGECLCADANGKDCRLLGGQTRGNDGLATTHEGDLAPDGKLVLPVWIARMTCPVWLGHIALDSE